MLYQCNCKQSVGGQAATAQKGEPMSGRYKAVPETTNNRRLVYVVIDTLTGEWMHVYDCFLWAEHKAEEMNKEWSPCTTCAFSDMDKSYYECMECDDRSYKK